MKIAIFSSELERLIHEEMRGGRFESMDELLVAALQALREREPCAEAERPRKNLAEFLRDSPFAGSDLDLERKQDFGHRNLWRRKG